MKLLHKNQEMIQDSPLKRNNHKIQTQKQKTITQSSPAFQKNIKLPGIGSPTKVESMESSTKSQIIQPSRFGLKEKLKPIEYKALQILGDLENQVEEIDIIFKKQDPNNLNLQKKISQYTQSIEPMMQRIKQPHDFKLKPLRRVESDFQMFKDIFVSPQQQRLDQINERVIRKQQEVKLQDIGEKLNNNQKNELSQIQIQKSQSVSIQSSMVKTQSDKKNIPKFNQSEIYQILNNSINLNSSLKEDLLIKQGTIQPTRNKKNELSLQANISILEQSLCMEPSNEPQKQFFDQLIQVQPPDLPNSTMASPLLPGNGYAPSIPLITNFDEASKNMIKDLLVRAKAGQQVGDVQKEAHIFFYLGMVYDNQKKYKEAMKQYKKFYTCARQIEDKIGMGLGANRIGCDYFHVQEYEKSVEYHRINIQYSDEENSFAGFYNLGIALRNSQNHQEAISNFQICLRWARERDELESECLSLGQLAFTHQEIGQTEEALFNFTDCYEISKKLRKTKLQLDCLLHITKLLQHTAMKNSENSIKVIRDAVDCAKSLEDKKTASLCLCNLGIMEGNKLYDQFIEEQNFTQPFEDWGNDNGSEKMIH